MESPFVAILAGRPRKDGLPHIVVMSTAVVAAFEKMESLLDEVVVKDPAHNMRHIEAVTEHVSNALTVTDLDAEQSMVCLLAAVLHEADDDKLFKTEDYANARRIVKDILAENWPKERIQVLADNVVEIIDLVSARKNKHREAPTGEEWKLIVRDADRIEAMGEVGIARCYAYNKKVGRPLFLGSTERATTEEELQKIATPERFAAYQDSMSMMDHYYDKLLHLAVCGSGNSALEAQMQPRKQVMIDLCLEFGRTGEIDKDKMEGLLELHCSKKDADNDKKRDCMQESLNSQSTEVPAKITKVGSCLNHMTGQVPLHQPEVSMHGA
jgi:HD superfamily phosphodiesterase